MRLPRVLWSPQRRREDRELRRRVASLLHAQAEHDRRRRVESIARTVCL